MTGQLLSLHLQKKEKKRAKKANYAGVAVAVLPEIGLCSLSLCLLDTRSGVKSAKVESVDPQTFLII